MRTPLGIAPALLALLLATASATRAQETTPLDRSATLDRAVAALRQRAVHVDAAAERRIPAADQAALEAEIARVAPARILIAILPASAASAAGGGPGDVLDTLAERLGRDATYAVVVGDSFRAANGALPSGRAADLATEAFDRRAGEGVTATLSEFVRLVGSGGPGPAGDGGGNGGSSGAWLLLLVVGAPLAFLAWRSLGRRRAREREAAEELAGVRREAEEDVQALAGDIAALDLEVELPTADPRAKEDYLRAAAAYERGRRELERARTVEQLAPVAAALEEGRYAMACARARLEGREPPAHRPPCFFDPRHGPSVRDADWAPPGGEPRPVPVCAADAVRVEAGEEPASRSVLDGGRRVPYWGASPAYGPYMGGFFAGMVPLLLVGTLLGGGLGLGAGDAWAADGDADLGGGDFGDLGGGDFGGGDFGGGGDF
ncbi:MAG: hypothetical protein R3C15_22000 [Thermoleophilia bacterium]